MKNSDEAVVIGIAETTSIIRYGVIAVLKKQTELHLTPIEIVSKTALTHCMKMHQPDILLVNPFFGGWFNIDDYKAEYPNVKFVALLSNMTNSEKLKSYDGEVTIFEEPEEIYKLITKLQKLPDDKDENTTETLSTREREILIYVVKGLSNKEIADKLYLSVNTIITHRRNINRKLDIHTVAGLTIYAIVNKLVDLNEVKI